MPESTTGQPESARPTPRKTWRGFLFKWTLRAAVVTAVTLAIITQSGVLAWLILPRIESAIGCHAEADRVSVTPSGVILISDLRLSVPGIDSTAGTFLEVPRLEVVPRWSGLLSGTIPIEHIQAQRPIIRLSQDRSLALNIAGLGGNSGGAAPDFVPAMELIDAVLDFGEHGRGWYTPLVSLRVGGQLSRMGAGSSRYTFELSEAAPAGPGKGPQPLNVKGEFDLSLRTGYLTLDHIDLSRWQRAAVPEGVRELWSRLSLTGEVQGTALSYTPKDGPVVSFSLRDVNMNVPIPAESDDDRARSEAIGQARPESALLAMKHVQGDLRFEQRGLIARLDGLIEDLPCQVKLETEGYDPATCGLTCHISASHFTLDERPKLLPFAPFYVKRNFKRFSGPNGVITGEVTLRREPPSENGTAADLRVLGRLDFERGEAAFEKFPYPFKDMKGTIVFNEEEVRILGITGSGPTGAKLLAHGRVAPPNDLGMVEVDVTVVDAPVDATLRAAVPERRKALLEFLFSERALSELNFEGHAAGDGFILGGDCEIRVAIRRDFGDESDYRTTIDVNMQEAGLMSAAFPYPANGRDMHLRITDDDVRLRVPTLRGRGESALTLEADIHLAPPDEPDQYDIRVTAANLPFDDLLVRALPDRKTDASAHTARSIVRSLGLSGIADGSARIFSKNGDDIGFQVIASLAGVTSTIGGEDCLVLRNLAGDVTVSDEDASAINLTGTLGEGSFSALLNSDRGGTAITTDAQASFEALPVAEPIEELVALADPNQASMLRELRSAYRPMGAVSGGLRLRPFDQGTHFALSIERLRDFSSAIFGGRLALTDVSGRVLVTSDRAEFDSFRTTLNFDSEPAGTLTAQGDVALSDRARGTLLLTLPDGRFESRLVQSAARAMRPAVASRLEELKLAGVFELDATLGTRSAESRGPDRGASLSGTLRPRSLALVRNGEEVRFDRVSGEIRFGPTGGEVSAIEALAPDWTVSADGRWSSTPAFDVDLTFGFESRGIPPDLLAALPVEAGGAFEAVHLNVSGPVTLRETRLRTIDDGTKLHLTASAEAGAASLEIGVPVMFDRAAAELDVIWPLEASQPPSVRADLTIPEFRASRARLTEGRVQIRSGETPGAYELEGMAAEMHGGMLSASASFGASGAASTYTAELHAARVDFASLLTDLKEETLTPGEVPDAPGSRGEIDGVITLTGSLGSADDRRGRGTLRISGGEVIALPGAMPMLRLSNLQPPMGEPLESATASFFLRGDVITFESLQASSESLLIVGDGTMTLPDTTLNLRFNSQGRGTIPILDDILRGLRNELMTTVVSGTIAAPEYRLEALPGTQRMLGSIFNGKKKELAPDRSDPSDQETK